MFLGFKKKGENALCHHFSSVLLCSIDPFLLFFSSNKFVATVSNKHWLNGSLCIKGVFAEPPVARMMAEGNYRAIYNLKSEPEQSQSNSHCVNLLFVCVDVFFVAKVLQSAVPRQRCTID